MKSAFALNRLAAAVCLAACGSTAFAAVGARVLVQEWNPTQPDKVGARILVDDPDIVTRSLQQAWQNARGLICQRLLAKLGASGAAAGQTLYDIECRLDPNAGFSVEAAGANALRATFSIRGNSITATSTVPDPLGREFDPRLSLTLDATLTVTLAVQADPDNTLRATQAVFSLGNAKIDSHNAAGDVLKFVADDLIPFFGGPNFKKMAENAVNSVSADLAAPFNGTLAPVNAKLRGPSNYVRVGIWGRPDRITVAFGPREIPPPGGGTISGVVRWDPAKFRTASCASFGLQASVQTGPGPLLSPNDYTNVGPAPTRNVGSMSIAPASDRECRFTISGVPAGWPNVVEGRLQGGNFAKSSGNTFISQSVVLRPDGWSGRIVASAANKNFLMAEKFSVHAVPEVERAPRDLLGPVTNPFADRLNHGVRVLTPSVAANPGKRAPVATSATTAAQAGAAVSLNPQPLPPKANPPVKPLQKANSTSAISPVQPGAAVLLNPQPLPPKANPPVPPLQKANSTSAISPVQPGAAVLLNPQPLPPKANPPVPPLQKANSASAIAPVQPGAAVSLNPQPLPPKANAPVKPLQKANIIGAIAPVQPGAAVSLNPQPLPPKASPLAAPLSLR